jgi:hypothetical protein
MLEDLDFLDGILSTSGLEQKAVSFALDGLEEGSSFKAQTKRAEFAIYSLRVELLRQLLQVPSFEAYSVTLAGSDLFADFCGCRSIDGIRWTSKSSLHRAATFFSEAQLQELNTRLVEASASASLCSRLGLEKPEDLSVCLIDSTRLPANIHFPVDWVLLRDVALTLIKAIELIRKEGLLNRMQSIPSQLIRSMNKLCIEMTHSRRKKGAKKLRKAVLRKMKRLLKRIGDHARKHRDLLDQNTTCTGLSDRQARRADHRLYALRQSRSK